MPTAWGQRSTVASSQHELVLKLSADGRGLIGEVRSATGEVQRFGAQAEASGEQVTEAFESAGGGARRFSDLVGTVGTAVLAAGAAAGTAFLGMARSAINTADEVAKMSTRLGVSTETISSLSLAAELGGSSLQELGVGLQQIARRAQDVASGGAGSIELFERLGIRALDLRGQIRPLDDLLGDVAERFSTMPDGAEKTAAAMELMGRSGAALIPTLNGGRAGLAAVRAEAEALGIVISQEMAQASEQFNDNMTRLQRGLSGVSMEIANELLPHLVELTDTTVAWFKEVREDGTLTLWIERIGMLLGYLDELAVFLIGRYVVAKVAATAATWGLVGAMNALPLVALTTALGLTGVAIYKLATAKAELSQAARETRDAIDAVTSATGQSRIQSISALADIKAETIGRLELARAAVEEAQAKLVLAQQNANPSNFGFGGTAAAIAEVGRTQRALQQLEEQSARLDREFARLAGNGVQAVVSGLLRTGVVTDTVTAAVEKNARASRESTRSRVEDTESMRDALVVLEESIRAYDEGQRLSQLMAREVRDLEDQVNGVADAQRQHNREIEALIELELRLIGSYGTLSTEQRALLDQLRQFIDRRRDLRLALDEQREGERLVAEEARLAMAEQEAAFRRLEQTSADVSHAIVRQWRGDTGAIKDLFKRWIDDLIAEFLRLRVVMPLLQGLMGGGGGMNWGSLVGGLFGMGGGGGGMMSMAAGAAGAGGTSWGSMLGYGVSGAQGMGYMGGLGGLWHGSGQVMPGASYLGTGVYGPGMQTAFQPTGLGYGMAAAGGLYAGYNRWQGSNQDAGGALGAAAYGAGTYAMGMGAMSMAAGTGFAAGMTGAFAIPVVGWIAAILMLVDMIAGGKLFGTGWKPDEYRSTFGVGPEGGSARLEVREERQRALFRGRAARYRDQDLPESAQTLVDAWQREVEQASRAASRRFGSTMAPIIEASWQTVIDAYDKDKVKSEIGTIFGETFNEGLEDFQLRVRGGQILSAIATYLTPDQIGRAVARRATAGPSGGGGPGSPDAPVGDQQKSLIAMVDQAIAAAMTGDLDAVNDAIQKAEDIAGEVSGTYEQSLAAVLAIASRWKGSAALFLEGAEFLLEAAVDIHRSAGLLGESGTLAEIADLIEEYQGQNETLVQTYFKVRESARLLETAVALTGAQLDLTREEFVRLAADITEAAGGLEVAQSLWNNFFQSYYGELELASRELDRMLAERDRALESIGLDATTTMAQFREQFEAALPTLTADEIVQWLRASEALAQATQLQGQYALALVDTSDNLEVILAGVAQGLAQMQPQWVSWSAAIADLRARNEALIRRTQELGATEQELGRVREFAEMRLQAMIDALRMRVEELGAELYGTPFSRIEDEIRRLESQSVSAASGLGGLGSAVSDLYARHRSGVEGIRAYLDRMLLGDLSALTPEEQLAEAWRQLEAMASAAESGDADALANLPQLADTYLRMLREYEASGDDFNQGFQAVRDLLGPLANLVFPDAPLGNQGGVAGSAPVAVTASAELQALYEERDRMLVEQEAAHRMQLAELFAAHMAEYSAAVRVPVLELMERMGFSLEALAADLGVNLDEITGESILAMAHMADLLGLRLGELTTGLGLELTDLGDGLRELLDDMGVSLDHITGGTVEALAGMAGALGLSLTELTTALGLELTDLAGGVTELTDRLGIDLGNLTTESTLALAGLARDLGVDLSELATAVGADLGELADAQSLLNQALASTVNGLPQAQRDQLAPLLEAITSATSEADARAAIEAAESAINAMPAGIRSQLAPYFEGVFPPGALTDLDFLEGIDSSASETARNTRDTYLAVQDMIGEFARLGRGMDLPGYATGLAYVPRDMPVVVHQGEKIIDPQSAAILDRYGIRVSGGGDPAELRAIRAELVSIGARIEALDRHNSEGHRDTAEAIAAEGAEDRSHREDMARQFENTSRSSRYD